MPSENENSVLIANPVNNEGVKKIELITDNTKRTALLSLLKGRRCTIIPFAFEANGKNITFYRGYLENYEDISNYINVRLNVIVKLKNNSFLVKYLRSDLSFAIQRIEGEVFEFVF